MKILLFDLDGVIVYPGGYRAAFIATVQHLARDMGLGALAESVDDSVPEAFEACGITSEWESSPICLAAMALEAWRAGAELRLPRSPADPAVPLPPLVAPGRALDFAALARRVSQAWQPGELASAAALRVLLADAAQAGADGRLPALGRVLASLLGDTRTLSASPTLRVFQHHALGSRAFEQTYGIPADFEAPSLIALHDRPGLSAAARDRVLSWGKSGEARAAIYTLRPSLPPRGLDLPPLGYSPEAELALELVGLESLTLVGYGRLSWLESHMGAPPDAFVKPSPVHALAAILAAWLGDERQALLASHGLAVEGRLPPGLEALNGEALDVNVFEDAPDGVRGAAAACGLLEQAGVRARLRAWGIATQTEKVRALQAAGARVFPNLDRALEALP